MISKNSKSAKMSKKPLLKKAPLKKASLKKARPIKESNTIYLSNLSYNRDRQGVKNLVSRYGQVKTINIVIDLETKASKGMAFVELTDVAEAKAAIAGLNGQDIDGRTLKANFAIPQNPLVLKLKSEIEAEKKALNQDFYKPKKKAKKTTESGFVPRKKALR